VTDSRTEITDGLAEGEVVVTGTLNERQGIFGGGGGFVGTGGGPGRTVQIERPGGGD
jgi:hypothetical protein